jgi:hypothetical protein
MGVESRNQAEAHVYVLGAMILTLLISSGKVDEQGRMPRVALSRWKPGNVDVYYGRVS